MDTSSNLKGCILVLIIFINRVSVQVIREPNISWVERSRRQTFAFAILDSTGIFSVGKLEMASICDPPTNIIRLQKDTLLQTLMAPTNVVCSDVWNVISKQDKACITAGSEKFEHIKQRFVL